jgi:hypothetical protein
MYSKFAPSGVVTKQDFKMQFFLEANVLKSSVWETGLNFKRGSADALKRFGRRSAGYKSEDTGGDALNK